MKVYVGVRRRAGRGVFVAMEGAAGERDYRLCGDENTARIATAILADHLGEAARAAALGAHFEGLMRDRLAGAFWTITAAEVEQALSGLGNGN
jgi:hypothetical protein